MKVLLVDNRALVGTATVRERERPMAAVTDRSVASQPSPHNQSPYPKELTPYKSHRSCVPKRHGLYDEHDGRLRDPAADRTRQLPHGLPEWEKADVQCNVGYRLQLDVRGVAPDCRAQCTACRVHLRTITTPTWLSRLGAPSTPSSSSSRAHGCNLSSKSDSAL